MAKRIRHIRRHLRASDAVAALLDEIERREQLLSTVRRQLPGEIAKRCRQAALEAGELTLFVDSPVWIDRFRFLCCDLVSDLATLGIKVETCRVRVRPADSHFDSIPERGEPVPAKRSTPPGADPADSELSRAMARLARTLGLP